MPMILTIYYHADAIAAEIYFAILHQRTQRHFDAQDTMMSFIDISPLS